MKSPYVALLTKKVWEICFGKTSQQAFTPRHTSVPFDIRRKKGVADWSVRHFTLIQVGKVQGVYCTATSLFVANFILIFEPCTLIRRKIAGGYNSSDTESG